MEVIRFKCAHASNVIDSNGITEHLVIFGVDHDELKKFYNWEEQADVKQLEITDDSGLQVSQSNYRCVGVMADHGHAVIELERE